MTVLTGVASASGLQSKWLVCPKPNPAATLRLFCFASAGHGPSMFRSWAGLLRPDIELSIVQLPGRESRWSEPALVNVSALIPALGEAFESRLDRSFALFGHSLGALLAFETSRYLRLTRGVVPNYLFASAHRAPQIPNRHPRISELSDVEFVAAVNARHGGVPETVANNKELMDLMLPSLKADYRVFEDYRYETEPPLSCPITAFGGASDVYVTEQELEPWRTQTNAAFTLRMIDGGHFFVNDVRQTVVSTVLDDLKRAGL